jgi:hypothetical protein
MIQENREIRVSAPISKSQLLCDEEYEISDDEEEVWMGEGSDENTIGADNELNR